MLTSNNLVNIGIFLGLIGTLLSSVMIWVSFRKAVSPYGHDMTRWAKYGQPLVTLALTSCLTGAGFGLGLVYGALSQTNEVLKLGFVTIVLCSGFSFGMFGFIYLLRVWLHGNITALRSRRNQ